MATLTSAASPQILVTQASLSRSDNEDDEAEKDAVAEAENRQQPEAETEDRLTDLEPEEVSRQYR